jgi:hypothetical protein
VEKERKEMEEEMERKEKVRVEKE